MNRRQFLRNTGLSACYLALPAFLSACARTTRDTQAASAATLLAPDTWGDAAPGKHADIVHLLNRITYGPRPGEVERVAQLGWDAFVEQQLHPERIDDSATDQRIAQFTTLAMSNADLLADYPRMGDPRPAIIGHELAAASLVRAIFSERQLFEVMVDVWSNHFNIYLGKNQCRWFKTSDDRDVIRAHALGKFRDLLLASAKSPAMLVYLDNAENVAPGARPNKTGGINENYAREVLELHTVGVDGGYTQADIQPVARALTGWTITRANADAPGMFQFVPRLHDNSAKRITFLDLDLPAGDGIKDGEAVLARLAEHPITAQRLARKLAITFVSDTPPDALVERVAQAYLANDTDIRAMLTVLLRSDEFKASAGQKIKLPLRSLVSQVRVLGAEVANQQALLNWLRQMGQPFFGWGSPNGYPQIGAAWVNTGGLLTRWNLAFALAEGRVRGVNADLSHFAPSTKASAEQFVDRVAGTLLHAPLPADARSALAAYVGDGRNAAKLSGVVGLLLASPAFQTH